MSPAKTSDLPEDSQDSPTIDAPPAFKIASRPEPLKASPTGWSPSQVVSSAYRFADAIRRDAARD